MTQPLKSKLQGMLEVVYPSVDCDFLAEQLLATMGLAPNADAPPAHQNHWDETDVLLITSSCFSIRGRIRAESRPVFL